MNLTRILAWSSLLIAALAWFLGARAAQAATVLAMDLPALVNESEHVVIATAESEQSHYRTTDKLIVTDVKLRVTASLKGSSHAGDALIATRLGGTVDRIGLSVPGEASFPVGRSAIVFLRRLGSELHVTGMSQGVLVIEGAGAEAKVLPGGGGAALVQRADDGKLTAAPDALLHAQSLREVLTQIRKLAAEPHAR